MKKKYILALSLMFSLSFSVPAFAADTTTTTNKATDYKSYAGLTPNSIFYPLDKAIENIELRFTKDPNKKIEKLLEIQKERLGEIQTLVEKDKKDLVPIAIAGLEDVTSQTQTEVSKAITDTNIVRSDADSDTTASDTNATAGSTSELNKEMDSIDSTGKSIEDTNTDSIEILDSIKDQLPQEEQDKLSSVIEMQKQKKEAVKQMVSAIHDLNTARKQLNEANKALKDATKSGDSNAIAKAQEALNVANATFTQKQTELETAKTNKQSVIQQAKVSKDSGTTTKESDSDDTATTPTTESESSNSSTNTEGSSTAISSTSVVQAPNPTDKKTTNAKGNSTTELKKKEDSENKVSSEKKETKDSEQEVKKTEHSNEKDKEND